MNDFLKQFFRTTSGSADQPIEPDRLDQSIKEQFSTHQRLTGHIALGEILRTQSEELALALNLHASQYCKSLNQVNTEARLVVSEPARIAEPIQWLAKRPHDKSDERPSHYFRWKVSGNHNLLSVRASRGLIEFFLVPDKEVPHITMSEFGSRFKGSFNLIQSEKGLVWKRGNNRLTAEQALIFIETFLDQLSIEKHKTAEPNVQVRQTMASAQKQLELEKNNLLFKLLNQQEEMKNQLARDLHDSVVADLMMLKRYLSGDKKLSADETIEIIDEVVLHLRDIVNDYSPRQLQEWGLKVGIEDLLDRMARRTGMTCNFQFTGELPKFPELVSLHIFRLVQESLNNSEKHSSASVVSVEINASAGGNSIFKIQDNGRGFDVTNPIKDPDGAHSFGLEGMRERAELIKCFYPCKLNLQSSPTDGTTVILTISAFEQ